MPVAVAEKGLKRICPSCGTRYYDLNKRPVICPQCTTEFTGELKVKARRGRAAAIAEEEVNTPATANRKGANDDADDDEEVAEGDVETVSLEEVETEEAADEDDLDDALVLDEDLDDDLEDIEDELEDEAEEADEKE